VYKKSSDDEGLQNPKVFIEKFKVNLTKDLNPLIVFKQDVFKIKKAGRGGLLFSCGTKV
jgi:hypothetical protein